MKNICKKINDLKKDGPLMTEHLIETKYKGMGFKPRLKEKQGKEARTSKIHAEKHRYRRRDLSLIHI